MEHLTRTAETLLSEKPTRLFHRQHQGCCHPLSVLVEVAARRIFSISKAFNSASPKRNRGKYTVIAALAARAVNELALVYLELKDPEGEDFGGEWPVFKHHILAKPAKSVLPQLLIKAVCSEVHLLSGYLVSSSHSSMANQAQQHIAMALKYSLSIDTLLDEIYTATGHLVKWPVPADPKRSNAV